MDMHDDEMANERRGPSATDVSAGDDLTPDDVHRIFEQAAAFIAQMRRRESLANSVTIH